MAVNQKQFAVALLGRLGIQPTRGNVRALVGWANAEGGNWHNSASFNPLNTTLRRPGSHVMGGGNSAGVQAYRNWHQGLRATAMTLRNYPGILGALRSGNPGRVADAIGSSPWGTSSSLIHSAIGATHVGGIPSHVPGVLRRAGAPGQGQAGLTVPTASAGVPAGSTGALDLVQQLTQQVARPAGSMLTPPSFAAGPQTPKGYQAPAASAGPAPKATMDALLKAIQTPAQDTSSSVAGVSLPTPRSNAEAGGQAAASGGVAAAIQYAQNHVGRREVGVNRGHYVDKLERKFGLVGQPWCAMFTSVAVTHGGAPRSAMTASVPQVRDKARAHQGYEGFVGNSNGRAGDLILWGNDHIGMIVGRTKGGYVMIAGNDSNAVSKRVVPFGSGYTDIVRPAYGRRR